MRKQAFVPGCGAVALTLLTAEPAPAWLLHEHAATAHGAIARLEPSQRQLLQLAWGLAANASPRWCRTVDDSGEKLYTALDGGGACLSLPALTGLGGDHSCTPDQLGESLNEDFVLDVLQEAEVVESRLRHAESVAEHIDAWHQHHLELQIKDPGYLSRAEENGAHFQLPRRGGETLTSYVARVTSSEAPVNAIALYLTYHTAAVQLVRRGAAGCVGGTTVGTIACPTNEQSRNHLFAQALRAEAFALHFLQDAFSAGHVMSPTGSRAARMGTHDHYSEHGVAVRTWSGREYVAYGDSFMTRLDRQMVEEAVRSSLGEFVSGMLSPLTTEPDPPSVLSEFDACRAKHPAAQLGAEIVESPTLGLVPQPVLSPPGLPQFQEELGVFYVPFLGAAARVGIAGPARDDWRDWHRFPFVAFGGVGIGGTFEGVTDSSTDGIVALGINFFLDARPPGSNRGIRLGGGLNFHVPYYLVPGDLVLLAPFVIPWSFNEYLQLARRAAAGGVLGLQHKISLPWGMKFQFMLGREALIAFMPPPDESDDPATNLDETRAAGFALNGKPGYVRLALPVFSLDGFHASSEQVGLDAVWQLGYDFTYYSRSERWVGGAARGETHHGLFLSFSYRARRYVWVP